MHKVYGEVLPKGQEELGQEEKGVMYGDWRE